jgi:DNA-binding beta-propeller fold protein YncE
VPEQPIGSAPSGILVDPATDSVYAANLLGLGSLSIFTG